jgi:hypothetical protein
MRAQVRLAKLLATLVVFLSGPVHALPFAVDAGWQSFLFAGSGSAFTFDFNLSRPAWFRGTDGGVNGNLFTISFNGDAALESSLFGGPLLIQLAALDGVHEFYEPGWESADFASLEVLLGVGTYSLLATRVDALNRESGLGFRIDSVPEPATAGLATLGFLMATQRIVRRRRSSARN